MRPHKVSNLSHTPFLLVHVAVCHKGRVLGFSLDLSSCVLGTILPAP